MLICVIKVFSPGSTFYNVSISILKPKNNKHWHKPHSDDDSKNRGTSLNIRAVKWKVWGKAISVKPLRVASEWHRLITVLIQKGGCYTVINILLSLQYCCNDKHHIKHYPCLFLLRYRLMKPFNIPNLKAIETKYQIFLLNLFPRHLNDQSPPLHNKSPIIYNNKISAKLLLIFYKWWDEKNRW